MILEVSALFYPFSSIFNSAVFKEMSRYFHSPGVGGGGVCRRAKTLTFSNISVILEFFFEKLCPFFDLEFSKCSRISLLLLKIFT